MSGANVVAATVIGMGATLLIDVWATFLRRVFGVQSLNYCMLGRWVLHMPNGKLVHSSIAAAARKEHECKVGWGTHYLIGVVFALTFVAIAPNDWLGAPTLFPALAFGVVTVLVPFFTLQPALGLGIASSKTAHPFKARLKSVATHAVFGLGLWVWALLLSTALTR
jgi:hypothetical protein